MVHSRALEDGSYRACGFWRCATPAEWLKRNYEVEVTGDPTLGHMTDFTRIQKELKDITDESIKEAALKQVAEWQEKIWTNYDVVVFHHLDDPFWIMQFFGGRDFYSKKFGIEKKIIIDLDDNYDKIQSINRDLLFKTTKDYDEGLHALNIAVKFADGVTVTTEGLQEHYRQYNKNTYVCPNMLWKDFFAPKDMRASDEEVNIVYWGSSTHWADLGLIKEVLLDILNEYPNVTLFLGGQSYFEELNQHKQVIDIGGRSSFALHAERINDYRFDIGIAPLDDCVFNECKSSIKYYEYSQYYIAGIYQRGDNLPYNIVRHQDTGLLAVNYKDYKRHLKTLIDNPQLRHKIAENAYNDVMANYTLDKLGPIWDSVYSQIIDGKASDNVRMAKLGLVTARR